MLTLAVYFIISASATLYSQLKKNSEWRYDETDSKSVEDVFSLLLSPSSTAALPSTPKRARVVTHDRPAGAAFSIPADALTDVAASLDDEFARERTPRASRRIMPSMELPEPSKATTVSVDFDEDPAVLDRRLIKCLLVSVASMLVTTLARRGRFVAADLTLFEPKLAFLTNQISLAEIALVSGFEVPAGFNPHAQVRIVDEARKLGMGETADLIDSISLLVQGASFTAKPGIRAIIDTLARKVSMLSQLLQGDSI